MLLFVSRKVPDLYSNVLVISIIMASSYNLRSLSIFEKNRNAVISRKFGTIFICMSQKGPFFEKSSPALCFGKSVIVLLWITTQFAKTIITAKGEQTVEIIFWAPDVQQTEWTNNLKSKDWCQDSWVPDQLKIIITYLILVFDTSWSPNFGH